MRLDRLARTVNPLRYQFWSGSGGVEDGVVAKTLTAAPYQTSWDTTAVADGTHTVGGRAYDAAGNVGSSAVTRIYVQQPVSTPGASSSAEIVLYAKDATLVQGNWTVVTDAEAAGGARVWNPDAGAAKLSAPLASPASYVELTFDAQAGTPYRLWLRGKAERNYWGNDSVFVQFAGSVDSVGSPIYRIGTTKGATVNLEDCSSCGISGWGVVHPEMTDLCRRHVQGKKPACPGIDLREIHESQVAAKGLVSADAFIIVQKVAAPVQDELAPVYFDRLHVM